MLLVSVNETGLRSVCVRVCVCVTGVYNAVVCTGLSLFFESRLLSAASSFTLKNGTTAELFFRENAVFFPPRFIYSERRVLLVHTLAVTHFHT